MPEIFPSDAKAAIREQALALGFDAVGFAKAASAAEAKAGLARFLAEGFQGDMGWLAARAAERADPQALWPQAQSLILVGLNYGPAQDPLALLDHPTRANISVYARGRDYHDIVKSKLKALGRFVAERYGAEIKVFVDTAPVLEKHLAQQGGLGWQGKHSNLVSRQFGSWLFLGEIFADLAIEPDAPESDHCGQCRACLDICPTAAFPEPYRLDARRCISYLTIEHKGTIAREFRKAIGNRIYGCDDCLAVCPWNKFASRAREAGLTPRAELMGPQLLDLLELDEASFRSFFAGSPVKRTGRVRFLRNLLIALGNSGDPLALPAVIRKLEDPAPLLRAMAVWAASQLAGAAAFADLRRRYEPGEADPTVIAEWRAA